MKKADVLCNKYEHFMNKNGWDRKDENICLPIMRKAIIEFVKGHNNVAIYGYGAHTEHLMLDFVAELRDIRIIIDNYFDKGKQTGYKIIREKELRDVTVDGIIISIYAERDAIINSLKENYPHIEVLDFYGLFKKMKVEVEGAYYHQGQGAYIYRIINKEKEAIKKHTKESDRIGILRDMIGNYCIIKDFASAKRLAEEVYDEYHLEEDKLLISWINDLYTDELNLIGEIDSNVIYMLCIDGLRRSDLTRKKMPKLYSVLEEKGIWYDNVYSYSTSTYESLVPAYSENTDQTTRYYEDSEIATGGCRYIEEAKRLKKTILLNTGAGRYFDDEYIVYRSGVQTITEHIWDFIITASKNDSLLYYSQPQCESHFPFYNPYTENPVFDGTAILFDYLDRYGNKIRTDYVAQQRDAIEYLDDVLTPVFERLKCKFLIYSDHGNAVINEKERIESLKKQYFGCHEDWLRIPMVLHNNIQRGRNKELGTLLDINDIVISLLRGEKYHVKKREWVKIGRSEIYNPDFRVVYKKAGAEHFLLAFEGFVFESGYKLIVYSDGTKELYTIEDDNIVHDDETTEQLFFETKREVTVAK